MKLRPRQAAWLKTPTCRDLVSFVPRRKMSPPWWPRAVRATRMDAAFLQHQSAGSYSSSGSVGGESAWKSSSVSRTGDEITYLPLAQLPRSIVRQRSLQKGNSGSGAATGFLQMGQRRLTVRFSITQSRSGLEDPRHKIVIVRLHDLAAIELSGLWVQTLGKFIDEDFAVDFRCVHGGSTFKQ